MFTATADSIDALLRSVFQQLLSNDSRNRQVESRKGKSTEVFGVLLELTNPRARISRSINRSKITSAIGELAWYLSGDDSLAFIIHYLKKYHQFSDDKLKLNGAYGKRIFGQSKNYKIGEVNKFGSEWQRVIDTLRERPGSRNATIQIFSNDDVRLESLDIPCTCIIQFVAREGLLDLGVHMRSNDAYIGLPHDVFSFTMLQEIAARELGYEIGRYFHSVGSLHIYDKLEDMNPRILAQEYINEHYLDCYPMAAMPLGDPWPNIKEFLCVEKSLRINGPTYEIPTMMSPYWKELAIMLKIHTSPPEYTAQIIKNYFEYLSDGFKVFAIDKLKKSLGSEQNALHYLKGS